MANVTKKRLFSRFSLASTRLFATSVFARFLSLYHTANERMQESASPKRERAALRRVKNAYLSFKGSFARLTEESTVVRLYRNLIRAVLTLRLKCVGLFFFTFGFATVFLYLGRRFLPFFDGAQSSQLIFGIFLCLASLPLFFRRRSLATALLQSRAVSSFLSQVVLLRAAEVHKGHGHSADFLCAAAGLIFGLLGLFTSPFSLLFLLFVLVLAAISLYKPEFGACLVFFFLPLVSAKTDVTLILFSAVCLVLKVLRGKRAWHHDLLSATALIFGAFVLLSGLFSPLGVQENAALLFCGVLFFFVVHNLSRRTEVFRVLLRSFTSGAASLSLLRTLFFLLPEKLLDGELLNLARATEHAALPAFTVTALVLCLYFLLQKESAAKKLFSFICFALFVFDLWLYNSIAAYVAASIGLFLLLCVYSRALFFLLVSGAIIGVALLPIIEGSQTAFLQEALASRAPSAFFVQAPLPSGSFFLGLGAFSPDALAELNVSDTLFENLSFYTHLLLSVGVFGLLLLALFLLFGMQKASHYYLNASYNKHRLQTLSPVVCILTLLLLGLAQNLFSDARIMTLLFSLCAVSSASVDTLCAEDRVILQRF